MNLYIVTNIAAIHHSSALELHIEIMKALKNLEIIRTSLFILWVNGYFPFITATEVH